jgi:hypothetical protein
MTTTLGWVKPDLVVPKTDTSCWWCSRQMQDGDVFDGPLDPPIVIHDGKLACFFHAAFYVGALGGLPPSQWGRSL